MIARLEMLEDSAWRYVTLQAVATRIDRSSGQNATVQVSD